MGSEPVWFDKPAQTYDSGVWGSPVFGDDPVWGSEAGVRSDLGVWGSPDTALYAAEESFLDKFNMLKVNEEVENKRRGSSVEGEKSDDICGSNPNMQASYGSKLVVKIVSFFTKNENF